jgi:hypothetical protein
MVTNLDGKLSVLSHAVILECYKLIAERYARRQIWGLAGVLSSERMDHVSMATNVEPP